MAGGLERSGALDGVRGVFLAAPIVVHLGLAGPGNGLWLAIGLFFALSGFLITALALQEVERTGRLSLSGFWARRLRRLMAASILVLVLTLVVAWWLGWPAMAGLREDTVAALTWRANWHQLSGGGYWSSFAPSLTSHFWSLSLEEQVYLVMPLVIVAGVALARWARPAVTVAVLSGGVWVASWTLLWRTTDPAEIYLSTFTRAGEVALGCLAAALSSLVPVRVPRPRRTTLIVVALALVEVPVWMLARGDTESGLRWGITLSTPAVVLAVTLMWRHPSAMAARALAVAPLAWLGRRSYGIYLLHIPVIELLAFRLGVERLPGWGMVLAVAVTVALATLMFRFVEEPVRVRRVAPLRSQFATVLAAGAAGVVFLGTVAGRAGPGLPLADVTPPIPTAAAGAPLPGADASSDPADGAGAPAARPAPGTDGALTDGAPADGAAAAPVDGAAEPADGAPTARPDGALAVPTDRGTADGRPIDRETANREPADGATTGGGSAGDATTGRGPSGDAVDAPAPAPQEPVAVQPASFPLTPGNVLLLGDSTAWVAGAAVRDALEPAGWRSESVHMVGCPFGGDVRIKSSLDGGRVYVRELGEEPGCDLWWDESVPSWLADRAPALVVVIGGYGLAYEVDPAGDGRWCRLGDGSGRCEAWAAQRLQAMTERILQHAPTTHIVWTTPGHVDPYGPLDIPTPAIDALTTLLRAEAARAGMSLVDFGPWLDDHLHLTVDGTHLGPAGVEALTPWMTDELTATVAGRRLAPNVA